MKDIQERPRKLIISGGDRSIDFQVANHALDLVALAIDGPVPADFVFPVGFGWNAAANAFVVQASSDGIGIVALIGKEISGLLVGQRHYVFECRAVRRFAGREMEDEWDAFGITETMNFTGEPAPRTAKSLFASPLFRRQPRHHRDPSSNPGRGGSCRPSPGRGPWRPLPSQAGEPGDEFERSVNHEGVKYRCSPSDR